MVHLKSNKIIKLQKKNEKQSLSKYQTLSKYNGPIQNWFEWSNGSTHDPISPVKTWFDFYFIFFKTTKF